MSYSKLTSRLTSTLASTEECTSEKEAIRRLLKAKREVDSALRELVGDCNDLVALSTYFKTAEDAAEFLGVTVSEYLHACRIRGIKVGELAD